MSLKDLLPAAFELKPYQLYYRAPWFGLEHYDVIGKVPAGTTEERFHLMQQSLLVERFEVTLHWEEREVTGYALIVDKGGPKIQQVTEDRTPGDISMPVRSKEGTSRPVVGKDGLFIVAPGETRVLSYHGGISAGIIAANAPMGRIAESLGRLLKTEVIDQTALAGKFTFRLDFL